MRWHHVFANGGDCAERVVMEDRALTTFASESVYRRTVGRPRKYACSWFAVNKRIYLAEETLEKLRSVKTHDGFGSDDATVQHLVKCYERLRAVER